MEKMNKLFAAAVIAIIASIFATDAIADTENYGSEFSISESPQPPQPSNTTAYFGSEFEITGGNNPPVPPDDGDTGYFGSELLIGDESGPGPWIGDDNSMLFWYFITILVIVFIIGLVAIAIFARR